MEGSFKGAGMGWGCRGCGVGVGETEHALPRHAGPLWQSLCEHSNFFVTDLCDSWKADPRTGCSPLSTININMCMGLHCLFLSV